MPQSNSFGAASTLTVGGRQYRYFALEALKKRGANISRIPYSIKILLENLLRTENGATVKASDIDYVAAWKIGAQAQEINFSPARVLLQDFTGVPCVVDLAAMRDALREMGADPKRANPNHYFRLRKAVEDARLGLDLVAEELHHHQDQHAVVN